MSLLSHKARILPVAGFGWAVGALTAVPQVPDGLAPGVLGQTSVLGFLLVSILIGLAVWPLMERVVGQALALAAGLCLAVVGALGWGSAQDAEALFMWRMVYLTGAVAGPAAPATTWLMASGKPTLGQVSLAVLLGMTAAAMLSFLLVWALQGIAGWRAIGFVAAALASAGLVPILEPARDALERLSRGDRHGA